ncbi:chaperone protein DnaJ [Cucumis melo var. makuwa]|uniref:Chaperone protein DnaJ n=1 Tax=Cucumis melo var. makuwa TaxID=1194695 RepID=A0A5A7SXZ9_CUCMM|nr:chaperone protein DnaJ [Cucumis melo var. makuwa]
MRGDEARTLLGFSPGSRPSSSQVKEAYKRMVWDTHPDLFPAHQKPQAESKFKLVNILLAEFSYEAKFWTATYERVVRRGVPVSHGGRRNHALIKLPFLLLILGTVSLGGLNVSRAYKRQKEMYPSHNPFLP